MGEHNGTKTELYRTNTKSQGLVPSMIISIVVHVVKHQSVLIYRRKGSLRMMLGSPSIINPRRACARVTVLALSVCLFSLFWHLAQSGVQTAVSATSAQYGHEI